MDDAEFDEKDIEDEIARELSCLDSEDELSSALTAADDDYDQQQLSNDEQSVPDVQLVALPESKALKDLQKKLSTTRKTFEKQLEDCSHLLQSAEDKLNSCKNVSLGGISEGFRLDGESDADVLSRVYREIEEENEAEENLADEDLCADEPVYLIDVQATDASEGFGLRENKGGDFIQQQKNGTDLESEPSVEVSTGGAPVTHMSDVNVLADSVPVADDDSEHLLALVPYDENNLTLLQRNARAEMKKLVDKQKNNADRKQQTRQTFLQAKQAWDEESVVERSKRHEANKSEEVRLKTLTELRQGELQKQIKAREKKFSEMAHQFESEIYALEKRTQDEQTRLHAEINGIKERRKTLETKSAVVIQSAYRGYRTRQEYGEILKEQIADGKEERLGQKIRQAEKRIAESARKKKQEAEEKRRADEEQANLAEEARQKALAEKQAREAEKQAKQEELRLQKEKEAEEKKQREERKRLEKEKKLEAARVRKQEERERKELEKREEKERKEREKREREEEKVREEQQKVREEEEKRLQQEAADKLREQQEKIRRERDEQMKLENELQETKPTNNTAPPPSIPAPPPSIPAPPPSIPAPPPSIPTKNINGLLTEGQENGVRVQSAGDTSLSDESPQRDNPETNSASNIKLAAQPSSLNSENELSSGIEKEKPNESTSSTEQEQEAEKLLRESEQQRRATEKRLAEKRLAEQLAEKERKQAQYKAWMEERKAANKTSSRRSEVKVRAQQAPVDTSGIEAKIEERRIRWIQECTTPWSQVSSKAKSNTSKPRRNLRRPQSAAVKHAPVSEELVLLKSACHSISQVEAVQLDDLPGCTLTTLSTARSLRALSLINSQLCTVDSLDKSTKLQYVHLKENTINTISLTSTALVYLNLSSNNLHYIKGFESCSNLKYLNLSNNKISKLANLGFHRSLHTLNVSDNELISTRGLGECISLQLLELSNNHLTIIDELDKLCLLRQLTANSNNIMEIPRLANNVLLECLILDDNSISSVDGLAYCWLPSLHSVRLSQNSVSSIQTLHGAVSLRNLTLTHNQLIDPHNIKEGLRFCAKIEKLDLEGNPLYNKESNRLSIMSGLPQLKFIDDNKSPNHKAIDLKSEIFCLVESTHEAFSNLEQNYRHVISDHLSHFPTSNQQLLSSVTQLVSYYETMFGLAENVRYAHEYGTMTVDIPSSSIAESARDLFEAKLIDKSMEVKQVIAQQMPAEDDTPAVSISQTTANLSQPIPTSSAKDIFEKKLRATLESTPLKVSSENIQMIKDSISPLTSFNSALFARKDKHSSRSVTARSSRGHMRDEIRKHMNGAATRIQAWWRGTLFRRRLLRALEQAKELQGSESDDSDEDIAEVDLSSFDYNIDDVWLAPEVPNLPQNHAVLPPTLNLSHLHNGHSYEPAEAWNPSPSPVIGLSHGMADPHSDRSGDMSHRSKREELIQQDWGFKDAHTAELMMKRAKKLKYNAQNRKKLSKLDAVGRYEHQRKVTEAVEPPKVFAPIRKGAPKKEYFKALEEQAYKKDLIKSEQKDAAVERTFEWIHTQVNSQTTPAGVGSPGNSGDRVSSGDSQLPYMDKRVLEGGRTQLVGSPLEIMSVDSYYGPSSAGSHRTQLSYQHAAMDNNLTSQHSAPRDKKVNMETSNHNAKSSSSRNQAKKASHKSETHHLDGFNAWGSGLKRSKHH